MGCDVMDWEERRLPATARRPVSACTVLLHRGSTQSGCAVFPSVTHSHYKTSRSCVEKKKCWTFAEPSIFACEVTAALSSPPGQVALRGENGPSSRKALRCPGRGLLRLPHFHEAVPRRRCGLLGDDAAWPPLLQVWCVETYSQDMCVSVPLGCSVFFFGSSRWGGGRLLRLGCGARGLPSKVTLWEALKTHAAISFFSNLSGFYTR